VKVSMNPFNEIALEEAIRLKEGQLRRAFFVGALD